MQFKDYYKVLSVAQDASQGDIKTAYRKLARRYHPDVSKEEDAEDRFKEVGEAYEVLKDPEKRAAYDRLGSDWRAGQEFTPPSDWDEGFEFSGGGFTQDDGDPAAFSEFFENLFGRRVHAGGQARPGRSRGEDFFAKVSIDIEDAFQGATRQITLRHPVVTGDGQVTVKEHTLKVKIPPGVKPGQQIRLAGQGAPGVGSSPDGDLFLEVVFKPHALYRVEKNDVYLDLPVAPWEAALGATIKVPTLSGAVELKIPADSPQGRQLRLRGRGLPGKPSGDMFAVLKIVLPSGRDEAAQALYQKMAQELDFNPRASLGL